MNILKVANMHIRTQTHTRRHVMHTQLLFLCSPWALFYTKALAWPSARTAQKMCLLNAKYNVSVRIALTHRLCARRAALGTLRRVSMVIMIDSTCR